MSNISTDHKLIALDTGILGGSIALFENGVLVDSLVGNSDTSRAEDLLSEIDRLVIANNLAIEQMNSIAVSRGPGSYTGIRIGHSIAKGIASATVTETIGVPLLEAIFSVFDFKEATLVILPFNSKEYVWQLFSDAEPSKLSNPVPEINFLINFESLVNELKPLKIVCHPSLKEFVSNELDKRKDDDIELLFISTCLAKYVGSWAFNHPQNKDLSPIYSFNKAKHSNFF